MVRAAARHNALAARLRPWLVVALLGAVSLPGCLPGHHHLRPTSHAANGSTAARSLLERAQAACREAHRAERAGTDEAVDGYYAAAVYAYAALQEPGASLDARQQQRALSLYNTCLARCVRQAGRFGRIDPRSHLTVQTPIGVQTVPIAHQGFVWAPTDFDGLIDPCDVEPDENQHRQHRRDGLGAPLVAVHQSRNEGPSDRFERPRKAFAATAVLRPDLSVWLDRPGLAPGPGPGDRLELLDPLRVRQIAGPAGTMAPLAADFDAPIAQMASLVDSKQFTWQGFVFPSQAIQDSALYLVEPYQPGKPLVVLVHGLLDNPFVFADMITELRSEPGFVDRFQFATFRYPTGVNFLRTASILRQQLTAMVQTLDPAGTDPGIQNAVLLGYSMGGLLSKLQVSSSGQAVRQIVSSRPIDELVADERSRTLLHDLTEFEPVPQIKRVIYLGAPHGGSALATRALGRFANSLVRRDPQEQAAARKLIEDNPGVINPRLAKLPSSVDMMARESPLLEVMSNLPVNPEVTSHTILGTGFYDPESILARGDTIVPIESASIEGPVSELRVREIHTRLYYHEPVIAEVRRILHEHAALMAAGPVSTVIR